MPAGEQGGVTDRWRVPVAVDVPQHSGLVDRLDYESDRPLAAGTLVRVPLGRRDVPGIVWHDHRESLDPAPDGARLSKSTPPEPGGGAAGLPTTDAAGPDAVPAASAEPRPLKPVREVLDAIAPLPAAFTVPPLRVKTLLPRPALF